jgi:hypothetical protein
MAEGLTDEQIFDQLANYYPQYQEFLDKEGFTDDLIWAVEGAEGILDGMDAAAMKQYVEDNELSFGDIAKYYLSFITNPDTKDALEASIEENVDPVRASCTHRC